MAKRTCVNGHQYESNIYGDNCPFCPSQENKTHVNTTSFGDEGGHTRVLGEETDLKKTEFIGNAAGDAMPMGGGATVIRRADRTGLQADGGGRRLVGLLVSYSVNPLGEVYKIYEGRNVIGRSATSDIPVPTDSNMSSQHLLILYREAENIFWAVDQNSSNGTYINGAFVSDRIQIKTNDIIVVGGTRFVFLAIPQ